MTLKELFTSVANAIRTKGGTTAKIKASSFSTAIANLVGTATAGDVLSGKTFIGTANKTTGTMANRGAVSTSIGVGGSYTIPAGYHNGSGKVSNSVANKGAISGSVGVGGTYSSTQNGYVTTINVSGPTLSGNAGTGQVLSGYTFYSNSGTKQTGTMTNRGTWIGSVSPGGSVTIPAGYHNGSGKVTAGKTSASDISWSEVSMGANGYNYDNTQDFSISCSPGDIIAVCYKNQVKWPTVTGGYVIKGIVWYKVLVIIKATSSTVRVTNEEKQDSAYVVVRPST